MNPAQDSPKVAVVTGASSGIGWQTALTFARRGWSVVPAARRAARLDELADRCRALGAQAMPVPTDVSKEDQVDALVARAMERFGRIDVMVNNAGRGEFGRVHEISDRRMREVFDVNFYGVFYGCKAVAPIFMARRGGHIFNVSSVIGKRATPFHGAYCATKFAVCGLTESLRVEMKPCGVRVTSVCPALTDTEFFEHSRGGRSTQSRYVRRERMTPPEKIARAIVRAVGRDVPEMVFTAGGKCLVVLNTLWPGAADWILQRYHDDLLRARQEENQPQINTDIRR
ncbi:MAG TPA: short chain dehydrogenase [Phycisphaerales bacterium]|nr:short chain dehydrogenase [Phycisphaerales bacterium]